MNNSDLRDDADIPESGLILRQLSEDELSLPPINSAVLHRQYLRCRGQLARYWNGAVGPGSWANGSPYPYIGRSAGIGIAQS